MFEGAAEEEEEMDGEGDDGGEGEEPEDGGHGACYRADVMRWKRNFECIEAQVVPQRWEAESKERLKWGELRLCDFRGPSYMRKAVEKQEHMYALINSRVGI